MKEYFKLGIGFTLGCIITLTAIDTIAKKLNKKEK